MPLKIVRNDITKMAVDVIVNAANESLRGGGGVDGSIHRAAGPGLLAECKTLGGCKTGDVKVTKGYNLPCKYIIHTVGPVYSDGAHGEKELLRACYLKSLALARHLHCQSIAFPLISSGAYGYPKDKALKTATDAIGDFLLYNDMTVYLVIFDKKAFQIGERLFSDITRFIGDKYVAQHQDPDEIYRRRREAAKAYSKAAQAKDIPEEAELCALIEDCASAAPAPAQSKGECMYTCPLPGASVSYFDESSSLSDELESKLKILDESFSQMIIRKIDERGIKDSDCYKKANIDRKLFSKIRNNIHYKPSKPTALALAISLELSLSETEDLLRKAGFALSHSSKFDLIIEYFITKGIYNIFEINEALFAFDQCLLGA